MAELCQVGTALFHLRRKVDIIHSFGRLAALIPILPLKHLKKIQSYQRDQIPWTSVRMAATLAGNSITFTACGTHMYQRFLGRESGASNWLTVFNGVDLETYTFAASVPPDAPLVFLGRLARVKGAHNAIQIARSAGRKLIIAGNQIESGADAAYLNNVIAPSIDNERVVYIGAVDDAQKNQLLGSAAGLLMPVEWDEPFGIVMAEALACGTPVIGFRRGSIPEVVQDGTNGFLCNSHDEAVQAVTRLDEIDRCRVREDCEARFGADAIVDAYEQLYVEMLDT
jgi:glycosyltransferase involved in cell wall biosynthesis